MGKITGWLTAVCDTCDCRFNYYLSSPHPFVGSKIVGTCDKCINEEDHDCIDECQIDDSGRPMIMGRKIFKSDMKDDP